MTSQTLVLSAAKHLGAALALVALAACSVLPARPLLAETRALGAAESGATTLGAVAARSLPADAESGFQLLPIASAAYETRLALAAQAERTLDVQTFVLHADDTGKYLLDALRAASARGVRVRLLVDDLNTAGSDALLSAFAALPNVEVRLFNPFVVGRSSQAARLLASLNELGRVNHRMHNKLFVADNAVAVFGGRNTGDEYFMRAARGNFVDLDVLAAGAVVSQLSASFDSYWNSPYAYPVAAIVGAPRSPPDWRTALGEVAIPPVDETVPARFQRYLSAPSDLAAGRLQLVGARAIVRADPVDKVQGTRLVDRAGTVREFIGEVMRGSAQDVLVVSPYFVPGELGMEAIRLNRARGVDLRLLTNSLAATDEPMVHGGYLRYRREMLEAGVKIYELSPSLAQRTGRLGRFGTSLGILHAKIIVVDRARLFVGSMNLDSRSERYNTELGVLIDSAPLAEDLLDLMRFESSAYRVRLDAATGAVEWVAGEGAEERVLGSEPEASLWLRFKARVLSGLVPEAWL